MATIGLHSFRARRTEHAVRQHDGKVVVRVTSAAGTWCRALRVPGAARSCDEIGTYGEAVI